MGGSHGQPAYRGLSDLPRTAGASPSSLIDISTTDAVASYTDSYLRSGKTYTYGVQAIDTEDNAGPMRTIQVTTNSASDSTAPAAPGGVTTRIFSSSRIDITWGSSSSSDASGYQVLRNGVVVGQVDRPLRFYFSDNGLAANTTYSYTIKTIDSRGNLSGTSAAKSGKTLSAGGKIIARGPYLQSVTQTSARVVWWTNIPTTSRVDFGLGALTNTVADSALTLQHVMLLAQLSGGTTYTYKVGDGSLSSATATFNTAAPAGSTFTFAAIGDFGGNAPGEAQNANLIAADGSQFIQTLGDNIYPEAADPNFATTYSDFDGRFFKQFGAALKLKAFWAANGNKEYYGHGAWAEHMILPNNERWYSYDWGSVHILVLDTEMPFAPGTPQYAFAQADLAAHQSSAWRIVALQRPAYSSSTASASSIPVRTYLTPLFEQQNVKLVLSGNSHNYERTYPLIGGTPATGGVTYVVSGNGGNGFNTFQLAQPSWSAYRQASYYGYLRVTVAPSSIQVSEIRADTGTVIDSTTIAGQADTIPPSQPTNLTATAPTATRVDLGWTASTDNVGVTAYDIYRGGNFLRVSWRRDDLHGQHRSAQHDLRLHRLGPGRSQQPFAHE